MQGFRPKTHGGTTDSEQFHNSESLKQPLLVQLPTRLPKLCSERSWQAGRHGRRDSPLECIVSISMQMLESVMSVFCRPVGILAARLKWRASDLVSNQNYSPTTPKTRLTGSRAASTWTNRHAWLATGEICTPAVAVFGMRCSR